MHKSWKFSFIDDWLVCIVYSDHHHHYQVIEFDFIQSQVYCEQGLNGGGYTFIHPRELPALSDGEVQSLFTDNFSFLMRTRNTDGTQRYAVLGQLPQYSSIPLKLGLNQNVGYNSPVNVGSLGLPYLYFGFLPVANSAVPSVQGLVMNGLNGTFSNQLGIPNSYISLFSKFPWNRSIYIQFLRDLASLQPHLHITQTKSIRQSHAWRILHVRGNQFRWRRMLHVHESHG